MFKNLYYKKITIDEAERGQNESNVIMNALKAYSPRNNKYIETKNKLLNNFKKLYEGREKIIEVFKNGIFSFVHDEVWEEQMRNKKEEEEMNNIQEKNGLIDYKKLMRKIGFKERYINRKLVKKHFFAYDLGDVLKNFKKSKINPDRNKVQVTIIKNELRDLKEQIKNMSEEGKKNQKTK